MGHWEALAADTRLGLESKLEAAAVEKRGKSYQPPEELRDLPKGESVLLLPCQLPLRPPHSIHLLACQSVLCKLWAVPDVHACGRAVLAEGSLFGILMC